MKYFSHRIITAVLFFCLAALSFSQEALKSTEEEYYDFLALQGIISRPTLNYRTLSDSTWTAPDTKDSTLWSSAALGTRKTVSDAITYKIYGPEWFNSYNTASPYGQNDGALWQGKGYNSSLTGGARLEAYGWELTLKPQLSFSQNQDFDYITPNYSGSTYAGKGAVYGYYGVQYVDAPQRFGDSSFFTFDWGDTEIRYTKKNITAGFGTQTIWLGPAQLNPIIHSNNAPSYPKFDIGFRKTALFLPFTNWYLGDAEFRGWWGYLSESDYFDTEDSNDHNLISGLAAAWAPPFLTGLSIGVNRTMLSKWSNKTSYTLIGIYDWLDLTAGNADSCDQRFSVTFDYLLPKAGFEAYLEWARNDFSPSMDYIIRYPFHTQGFTAGVRKAASFSSTLKGELLLEITGLECSMDYDRLIDWYSSFYTHGEITQGYTNGGQWLGAGIGTGGNSQYIGYTLYAPKWKGTLFIQRVNPDLDYTMYIDSVNNYAAFLLRDFVAEASIRVNLYFGTTISYFVSDHLRLNGGFVFIDERNPLNVANEDNSSKHRYNCSIQTGLKYNF
jgi:hypothetical protein